MASKARPIPEPRSARSLEGRVGLVYARVSTKRQEAEGSGLQSQENRCKGFLVAEKVPYEKSFLDSATGGGDFMNRPAMREMLAYIDAHPHKQYMVVFDDLKRFARDTEFHLKLRAALKARDVVPKCLNYNFDDSPEGLFAETIMAAQAELERHQNRRQVVQKMKARMEAGYYVFGSKRGYNIINDPIHGKIAVPNEDAKVLKEALEGFANRSLIRKVDVATFLVEKGFWKKQRPEKYIDKVSQLLSDPFYAGYIEYPLWGVARRKGHHKAIISSDTLGLNEKLIRKENGEKRVRQDISPDFPLRGLIVCSSCGKHLTGAWSKGRTKKYPYYFCQNFNCEYRNQYLNANEAHRRLAEVLKANKLKAGVEKLVARIFDKVWEEEVQTYNKSQEALASHKELLEKKAEALTEQILQANSEALKRIYEAQLEKIAQELEKSNRDTVGFIDTSIPYRTALEKATGLLKSPYSVWENLLVDEQQKLFFFIFEEKLPYSRKDGYRTAFSLSKTRLFEEFAVANSQDVEV